MSTGRHSERPPDAWNPEPVIDRLCAGLTRGDFYILCPDNAVSEAVDRGRIAWSAGDMLENRPALSRWHPDDADAFEAHMEQFES